MGFRKKEIALDVVVCCCILHNMRKSFDQNENEINENENQHQLRITTELERLPRNVRLQCHLIDHYFNI